MDINEIRSKLTSLQPKQKGEKKEKVDYSLYLWKPKTEGKTQIRVVSSVFNKKNPFKEVFLHYGLGKFPIYALSNWGEKDPIVEFAKKLRTGDFDKANWQLAGKLEPKMRVFAPIIVRGEEDKGVRLWEFGKELYNQFLSIADDEDYGDYTDINEGRDFTVTATPAELNGNKYLKCTIQIKPKSTPLSTDTQLIEKWLNEQPNILDIQKTYKKDFDTLKEILAKYINPEVEEAEEVEDEEEAVAETEKNDLPWKDENVKGKTVTSTKTPAKSKTKADKFDELFDKD